MMETVDCQVLDQMRDTIAVFQSKRIDVGSLADQLLMMRDRLQFQDREWYDAVTQQVATLDSASTFVPKNPEQARQFEAAIDSAVGEIVKLIDDKRTNNPLEQSK